MKLEFKAEIPDGISEVRIIMVPREIENLKVEDSSTGGSPESVETKVGLVSPPLPEPPEEFAHIQV